LTEEVMETDVAIAAFTHIGMTEHATNKHTILSAYAIAPGTAPAERLRATKSELSA